MNSSVTLDFGGFESVLFNTPAQQNATTINNIPPDLNGQGDQKNSIKLSFDEDMVEQKALPKKRSFVNSTIKIQESSSDVSGEDVSTPEQPETTAVAADTKIVLNLFDDDEIMAPPAKKKKVEEKAPEPFFKS